MASTWSNLKIQLMGAGDESGTWGSVTNANLGTAIEEAISGSANITFTSADVTLTLTNTTASQPARNMRLNLVGTTGGSPRDLVVPAIEKMYVVNNTCGDTITIKVSGQTGIPVPAGKTVVVFNNGTDCVDAITHLTSLTLGSALSVASGGTGLTSPGTAGNVLTSTGSAWVSGAPFPSGGIIMWSGSIVSIPSGWYLCDGTNGTPDLRNRFIVGAGSTYAVAATGGSADAVVVAHTHTGTTDSNGAHTHTVPSGGYGSAGGSVRYSSTDNSNVWNNLAQTTGSNGAHTHTFTTASAGTSGTNANLPPYYALAYIMKA
jgi:hypothetical protein